LALEFLNGVVDYLWPQYGNLQFGEQTLLDEVRTLLQPIRASATVEVLRATVTVMAVLATSGHDNEVGSADATFHEARENIQAR
jgi:hypothetical protein